MATPAPQRIQQDHLTVLADFHRWRSRVEREHVGFIATQRGEIGAHDIVPSFVPRSVVKGYFTRQRVASILATFPESTSRDSVREITERFPRTLYILLSISWGQYVSTFLHEPKYTDDRLPLLHKPAILPEYVWTEFDRAQWSLAQCELDLMHTTYPAQAILPFTSNKIIDKGATSIIWKVSLHPDYDKLLPYTSLVDDKGHKIYALKQYITPHAATHHKRESGNFQKLRQNNRCPTGIIEYLGSFTHGDNHFLILEYAEGGSLENFIKTHDAPSSGRDILEFWKKMCELLKGLACMSSFDRSPNADETPRQFQGSHQDLRPGNIVLVKQDPSKQISSTMPYDVKISDLGISKIVATSDQQYLTPMDDSWGSITYGSPESYRPNALREKSRVTVTSRTDVFSLGCIFLVLAVWLARGKDGVRQFDEERKSENERSGGAANYRFHDGKLDLKDTQLLEVVRRWMTKEIPSNIRRSDNVTGAILTHLISPMLKIDATTRCAAVNLYDTALQILDDAEGQLTPRDSYEIESPAARSPTYGASARRLPTMIDASGLRPSNGLICASFMTQTPKPTLDTTLSQSSIYSANPYTSRNSADRGGVPAPRDHQNSATSYEIASHTRSISPHPHARQPSFSHDLHSATISRTQSSKGHSRALKSSSIPSTSFPDVMEGQTHCEPIYSYTGPAMMSRTSSPTTMHPLSPTSEAAVNEVETSNYTSKVPFDRIKIQDVIDWKDRRQSIRGVGKLTASELPGLKRAQKRIDKRDHIFIVDDSKSMHRYREHVRAAFEALSYVVKRCDKDGLDLWFTSEARKFHDRDTKLLLQAFDDRTFTSDTNIATRLDLILDSVKRDIRSESVKEKLKPTSIYILTDGIWGDARSVEFCIRSLMMEMKRHDKTRNDVGISFISFGDDKEALKRLDDLDNLGQQPDIGLDNVDREHFTGDVWKMLLGAIDHHYDNVKSPAC